MKNLRIGQGFENRFFEKCSKTTAFLFLGLETVCRPEKNEIVLRTMKSERGSDEIFGVPPQMKSKPCGFG